MNTARAVHIASCQLGYAWLPSWGAALASGRLDIAASRGASKAALAAAGSAAAVTAAASQNIGSRPMSTSTAPGASAAAAVSACMAGTCPAHMACSWVRTALQQRGQRMVKRMAPQPSSLRKEHVLTCEQLHNAVNDASYLPGCFNHKLQGIAC